LCSFTNAVNFNLYPGKLIVGSEDFTQQKAGLDLSLDLYSASYQIGGVSPLFDASVWKNVFDVVPFVGCMKSIFVSGASYDPLSGSYYGVQSPCSGRVSFTIWQIFKCLMESNCPNGVECEHMQSQWKK